MYLVTGNEDDFDSAPTREPREYETIADARQFAERITADGVRNVRVWLLTHSAELEPRVVWKEHAKGLSGL